MKILFAIKNMNTAKGGAERVLSQISAKLSTIGHDISIITFEKDEGESFYPLHPDTKRIHLGIGNAHTKAKTLETLCRISALRKTLKTEKPDIAIGFMHSMFIPLAFAAIGTGVPIIASEHIVPNHYKNRKIEFALFAIASLFIKRITILSRTVRKSYPAWLQKRMKIIANPVATADENFKKTKNPTKKIILNVGRLDPQKDQTTLIRAFSKIADKHPDWYVHIYGEGQLKNKLEALIKKLNMQERVLLKGTTKQIDKAYKSAQIFAMPSSYESFGLATAEAMSYGIPAIGFADCPGTNEIITNGEDGLLIKSSNRPKNFATALERLINDKSLRETLGQNAKQSAKAYSLDAITKTWLHTIHKAIK